MNGYIWSKDAHRSKQEEVDGAYWERNMLALAYANRVNGFQKFIHNIIFGHEVPPEIVCGWYEDKDNCNGLHRIISLDRGTITFHIPDNFDVGDLPKIEPNWNNMTKKQEWDRIADLNKANIDWS